MYVKASIKRIALVSDKCTCGHGTMPKPVVRV